MKIIPYSRQSIHQDDIEAVCAVLRSDWLTQGPKVREFEEALAAHCGARHCVAVSNGTVALHLACLALGVGPGDVGLTSPISFLASANCIAYCGGRPDFVDIDPETLCLSPEGVEKYCRTHTVPKVVIPVDFAGVPAALPRFKELGEEYGFKIIEDAAHSIGSTYEHDGKKFACASCAHTDLAIFSFHPVKSITTGEGGGILTNDDALAHRLRCLSNHGIERDSARFVTRHSSPSTHHSIPAWYYEMQYLGFNARITDIQCALGLAQLMRLHFYKEKRREIVKAYNKALRELEEKESVLLPPWPEGTDPCYHLYPLRLGPKCKMERDDLYYVLREKGIHCQVHYIPIYRQPFYRQSYPVEISQFPSAEQYFANCLSLPLFSTMTKGMFEKVLDVLLSLL